ncbi:hypothetical protein E9232_004633 [Inquilinus ginsengisoli]|uniref:Uncharacterized protein n=1 Tax=Inquilinus ginsengisoli TaxID=363840 RepID=A0ABU1JX17_9PROT|nr:hypothetical protein [Inquilinus ginsengisoli]MDR6292095.1 hypothetical protein [Inquilinus ginsengisoli]
MDKAPSDSEATEIQPVDPDREWTGWALGTLRELVDIDMRTARRIEVQQMATPIVPPPPDFALMQARIARAVRLSIAMTERIREAYRARKDEREKAAVALRERRQRRRAQVARAVVAAVGGEASADAGLQAKLRESLTEAETPDVELDTLPVDEIVRRICRRLGRSPDPALLPWAWDDADGDEEAPEVLDEPSDGDVEAAGEPPAGDGRPSRPDRPAGGRPPARPRKPDSS